MSRACTRRLCQPFGGVIDTEAEAPAATVVGAPLSNQYRQDTTPDGASEADSANEPAPPVVFHCPAG